MKITYQNEKLSTHIEGLDKILFGGVQLQNPEMESEGISGSRPLRIIICGELGTSKSLLGIQLLHGLTKSLYALKDGANEGEWSLYTPIIAIKEKTEKNVSDMLLDMLISKSCNQIVEDNIVNPDKWKNGSCFSSAIFNVNINDNHEDKEIYSYRHSPMYHNLDRYIAEGKIVYNNRTNALHLLYDSKLTNDVEKSLIAKRLYDDIAKYAQNIQTGDKNLNREFFPISFYSEGNTFLHTYFQTNGEDKIPCLLIFDKNSDAFVKFNHRALVIIQIMDEDILQSYDADLIIRLRNHTYKVNDYQCTQLSVIKSVMQTTARGWHQYKKQDYGFEVYPSTHLLLQRRRHMAKELLRTRFSILSETYAQYVYNASKYNTADLNGDGIFMLQDYEAKAEAREEEKWRDLVHSIGREECASSILREILIGKNSTNTYTEGHEGIVTAIIGEANTYKRFLTLGGTFSASCRGEHTLKILLDKEGDIMFRRIICPAMKFIRRDNNDCLSLYDNCKKCYGHIHFKEIRMGCISPDELFYYILKQIRLSRESKNSRQPHEIKRIIIDDLMKLDFCFPILRNDSLFLTTLISICKEEGIDLFILCDKSAELAYELRFQADNVICTERTSKDILLYIEKYSGYNDPSRIFGCRIANIEELFYCDRNKESSGLFLNDKQISGLSISTMSDYWVSNDTEKIANTIKRK